MTIPITWRDLLPLDIFTRDVPVDVDVVYANAQHDDNHFPDLYHPHARLFVHARLLPVILLAAKLAHQRHGWRLKINDCYRPIEAQEKMAGYSYPPELVSLPGHGAHPRGMAFDVEPVNEEGDTIPMGTPFDFFASDLAQNPASRTWTDFGPAAMSAQIIAHRTQLDACIFNAAAACGETLVGLPDEWWDYRFPASIYEAYAPLRETGLPGCYGITRAPEPVTHEIETHWQAERTRILAELPT